MRPKTPDDVRARSAREIRRSRKRANLTQEALARAAGVSLAAVRAWEHGRHVPSDECRAKLDRALAAKQEAQA